MTESEEIALHREYQQLYFKTIALQEQLLDIRNKFDKMHPVIENDDVDYYGTRSNFALSALQDMARVIGDMCYESLDKGVQMPYSNPYAIVWNVDEKYATGESNE